jgi:choline dehydrogenase
VRRPNLRIVTGAVATGVRLEGRRATGVRFRRAGATAEDLAPGAVVLAAGAIGSPHLLLLSGIGPAAALRRHGVAVACDLPGVGRNLQDHLAIGAMYRCRAPVTLAGAGRPGAVAAYLLRRRGLLTSNVAEAGAFLRLAPTAPAPDMELLIGVSYFLEHGFANPEGHGFTVAAILQHPASRGELTLASADPARAPVIRPHYLSAGSDLPRLVEGLELARSLVRRRAFDRFRGGEVLPDPATDPEAHVRTRSETLYHPVGTCRMGTDDEAVVTPSLGVHGLEDLWVADASVMPLIPTAHPHAAVVAIAERAAGFVRAALAGVSP